MGLDESLKSENDTQQQALNCLELAEVLNKVQCLPETMKQVIELRVLSDFSFKEIARQLGRSENWARVTFYRAKLILIKDLK